MRTTLTLLLALPLLSQGCDDEGNGKPGAAPAPGEPIAIAGIRFDLPEGWIVEEPKSVSAMLPRLAQFRLPRAEGDTKDGQLTAFHAAMGGSVQANIDRWKGQFTGGPVEPVAPEIFQVDGLRCTGVDFSGTYSVPPFMRKPNQPAAQEGRRMIGAILETPGNFPFIKVSGSIETIGLHRDAILAFLKSGRR